ncbi:FAD-binding protein [Microdochium nivale]|nr:FAD-binding protein [Microdochium nivale]
MRSQPLLSYLAMVASAMAAPSRRTADCRCLPGDSCWPSQSKWDDLNMAVGGRLVATVPVGSVCHDPTYDEQACAALRASYDEPATHYTSSSSMMTKFWGNQSCSPFTPREESCADLGNLVSYAVDVMQTSDIVAAINFVRSENIRLVVRNTGHDFVGRSTGRGALAVWTHNLKTTQLLPSYQSPLYSGPALKMGAGVHGSEMEAFLSQHGLVAVGGWCPSVGVAGGFTAGGGHSPLGSKFGMGADQTLEFEVVTANGSIVTASPTTNSDLYWALSGGGPGNYGVVTSVTVRVYPDAPVAGLLMMIDRSTVSDEDFWVAMRVLFERMTALVDSGVGATINLGPDVFYIIPLTAHGLTLAAAEALMKPFTDVLEHLEIQHLAQWVTSTGYNAHWTNFVAPGPVGMVWQSSARILPRAIVDDSDRLDDLMATLQDIVDKEQVTIGGTVVGAVKRTRAENAVLPAWRDGVALLGLLSRWSDAPQDWEAMGEMQQRLGSEMRARIEAVTPGGGTYMNEADGRQPNWREAFFGSNYEALVGVKQAWDPDSVFWAVQVPGSEAWTVAADGRMCRA